MTETVASSDVEQLEGGDLIQESLKRVRESTARNTAKWNDKSRFSTTSSKVKKDVKVQEKVKTANLQAKIADYLHGNL